jgi:hypothetical protein
MEQARITIKTFASPYCLSACKEALISCNFGIKKFSFKKPPKKKTLLFEYYHLVNLLEQGAMIFEIDL